MAVGVHSLSLLPTADRFRSRGGAILTDSVGALKMFCPRDRPLRKYVMYFIFLTVLKAGAARAGCRTIVTLRRRANRLYC